MRLAQILGLTTTQANKSYHFRWYPPKKYNFYNAQQNFYAVIGRIIAFALINNEMEKNMDNDKL